MSRKEEIHTPVELVVIPLELVVDEVDVVIPLELVVDEGFSVPVVVVLY